MKKILYLILAIAAFLRFYNLSSFPALNADEAAIGYNTYSLLETGLDEHGNSWPIHFQSFNDYKPGLYFYLSLPFIKLFGLNVLAVRTLGALSGIFSVLGIYLLTKKLFRNEKLSLLSALFLSLSPWHIHFSRGAWEVNLATTLIIFGVYFFIHWKESSKNKDLYFSIIFLSLSLYAYHAARVIVPLFSLALLFIYKEKVLEKKKIFLKAIIVGFLIILPLFYDLFSGSTFARAAGVGLFADTGPFNRTNELRGEHTDFTALFPTLLHNKVINYGLAFLENWAEHFHGEFLFVSGESIQRNKVPETGVMYFTDLLFVVAGMIFLLRNFKKNKKAGLTIISWLIIAPIAAALTFQSPHALRSQNMVIPLTVISALGFLFFYEKASSLKGKRSLIGRTFLTFLVIWQFGRYEMMYWKHMVKEYPYSSQYGLQELVEYIKDDGANYEKIIITDRYDQPYILFLFYLKYPPALFQKNHVLTAKDPYGFSTVRDFDKFTFISVGNWDDFRNTYPNAMIVGTDEEIPDEANVVKEIYGINGYKYFQVIAN